MTLLQELAALKPRAELFRVWVLMPAEYISKHPIDGCKMVIFQNSEVTQTLPFQ